MKPPAILTFDLEFWHNSQFLKKYLTPEMAGWADQTEKIIDRLLALLNQENQKATFFVLGQLAEKHPAVVKKIADQGHEIASHSYHHQKLSTLNQSDLEQEIKKSKELLENIIGKKVIGFRAPNFSLTEQVLVTLKNNDFKYDASIHPLKNKVINDFKEIKTSLGGIYFQLLPFWLYCWLVKKNKLPVLYFHPHELFDFTPKIKKAPWLKKTIKYWGTKSAWKKFIKLMEEFQFISVKQYLYENSID